MAIKQVRIGSMKDIHQYDDADYDEAIETTEPIAAGPPVDSDHVVTLGTQTVRGITSINIDNPTELNSLSGSNGDFIIVMDGGEATLYAYLDPGGAVNAPYIMDALGAGSERWYAVAGKYANQMAYIVGDIHGHDYYLKSTGGVGELQIRWNEASAVGRILSILVNTGNRSLSIEGDTVLDQDYSFDADVEFKTVACQGDQVITQQQAAEANASAVSAISLGAGSDQVDRSTFNTDLSTLVTEINAIKDTLNSLLGKLRTHGLIDT